MRRLNAARRSPEEALHIAVAQFLRVALPPEVLFFHVPNGGLRSKATAGKLKAMGARPGVPDFYLHWRDGGTAYTAWIELKSATGTLSYGQREFCGEVLMIGDFWATCRSLEEVVAALRAWRLRLRATLMPGGGFRTVAS